MNTTIFEQISNANVINTPQNQSNTVFMIYGVLQACQNEQHAWLEHMLVHVFAAIFYLESRKPHTLHKYKIDFL
jgi:hypothetical protein